MVPLAFDRTFQANPLAVLVAWGGASATSAGAAGAAGRALPSGSIGWDTAIGPTNSAARTVVTRPGAAEGATASLPHTTRGA